MIRAGIGVAAGVFVSLALVWSAEAGVVPLNGAAPDGRTYPDLVVDWWQWTLSIPDDQNPMRDPTGADAAVGQAGPVWFLAPSLGGDFTRRVTVPRDKYFFFPVVTTAVLNGPGEEFTDADMRTQLNDFLGATSILYASIDGEQILDLWTYRVSSPVGGFDVTLPENNVFGIPAGAYPPPVVADGWWVLLEPLSTGLHRINFQGETDDPNDPAFQQATQYYVTIPVPEPAMFALLMLGGVVLCGRQSRR